MAAKSKGGGRARPETAWAFLTNHAHVPLLSKNPVMRLRAAQNFPPGLTSNYSATRWGYGLLTLSGRMALRAKIGPCKTR